jgi:hypothetical protein
MLDEGERTVMAMLVGEMKREVAVGEVELR